MPEDHAIIVGLTRYPELNPLEGAELDAIDFHQWVTDAGGGGVAPANARRILSSEYPVPPDASPSTPTEDAIEGAFEKLWKRGQKQGRFGGRLYVFFAGHGLCPTENGIPRTDEAALLTANAAEGRFHHVAGRVYADYFKAAAFFDEVVLFMDCCREHRTRLPLSKPPWEAIVASTPSLSCYAFSTDWNRASREAAWKNGKVRGLFSLALMNSLRGGAPREADGSIMSTSLEDVVYTEMRKISAERVAAGSSADVTTPTYDQDPIWFQMRQQPLRFQCRAPRSQIVVRLAGAYVGQQVTLKDGALKLLAPASLSDTEWRWSIPSSGLYQISLPDGTTRTLQITDPSEPCNVFVP